MTPRTSPPYAVEKTPPKGLFAVVDTRGAAAETRVIACCKRRRDAETLAAHLNAAHLKTRAAQAEAAS